MDENDNLLDGIDLDLPDEQPAAKKSEQSTKPGSGGEFFGPYQLIHEVGVGAVARVWRARHIHPRYADTAFAIKILHDKLSNDPRIVALFRNEAYVLAMLDHPNIVKTFEAGVQDNRLFIAMEYVDGHDLDLLALRCQRGKFSIPIDMGVHLIGETLKALVFAHGLCDADKKHLNLVHRDVNPSNVFLSYDGRVKLGDFGVAEIAAGEVEKERELAGKIGYFAPEQLSGGEVDQRADVFAVGVMMFEVLCGTRLFSGEDADKVMRDNRKAKIPKPSKINASIPQPLENIILKALERKPNDRFASAQEMLEALQGFLPDTQGIALAVAALMRKAFLREHMRELQVREGLSGIGPGRGSGQIVGLFTQDVRARAAFTELLNSRGYHVESHDTLQSLGNAAVGGKPPNLALLDVCAANFAENAALEALKRFPRPTPVIAFCESLENAWIQKAHAIGALDLLFKPFNVEHVLTSVRGVLMGAMQRQLPDEPTKATTKAKTQARVLLVSKDPVLLANLSAKLEENGYRVDVSPNILEAIERVTHASYHAAVYDAFPVSPSDPRFADQLRAQPGMGIVPVVFLVDPTSKMPFAGASTDRAVIQSRNDDAGKLLEALEALKKDVRLGRTFSRYRTEFEVEIRTGGRVFPGKATDVSRGGMKIMCEQMPPVGKSVSLTLKLPDNVGILEAHGCVARVDLHKRSDQHMSFIGVEFDHFSRRDETAYIAYLCGLAKSPWRRNTMIVDFPASENGED